MALFEDIKDRANLKFDPGALAAKYKNERDKRVRPDTDDQYIQASLNSRAHLVVSDPYAPHQERAAMDQDLDVLVIGGGWAGLLTAARLKQDGVSNFKIVESGGDFGGTWYWNRYPGAQCDIQSYIYLPLLEETGYVPKERYSFAPEIQEHAQRIGKHFDLYDHAVFQTFVSGLRWNEVTSRWDVSTNRGDTFHAKFVAMALGPLHEVRLPGIPGIDSFKGHTFHTSRWDYEYTGGGPNERAMPKLADKRVAVIGTGATAIQCVPRVAEAAKHLTVFQRTPSTVSRRQNAPTNPEWAQSLQPGWQREMMGQFERAIAGEVIDSDFIRNEDMLAMMTNVREIMAQVPPDKFSPETLPEVMQLADYKTLEDIRGRVESIVSDPGTAEKLKPWYNFLCKRPTFNDEYLPAFNRENVTLVDVSASRGVERITEKGIVTAGVEHEVDCIVFASGFEATSAYEKRFGLPIEGVGGKSLYHHWKDGMRSMHALMFNGFPNLFNVGGIFPFQSGLNYSSMIIDQAQHVSYIVNQTSERQAKSIQPSREGEETWLAAQLAPPEIFRPIIIGGSPESCTPGYYNHEGKAADKRLDHRREGFDKGALVYLNMLADWRANGRLEGMELGA